MAKLVNLRTVRKQRARDAERQATSKTGADTAETERARAAAKLERRRLDAHRRDDSET